MSAPGAAAPSFANRNLVARSRASSKATSVALDAVSCSTPVKLSGKPIICRSHSIIACSVSVAAGEVFHDMHCAPIAAVSISARIDAGLWSPGK